jgi:hypothetical protein
METLDREAKKKIRKQISVVLDAHCHVCPCIKSTKQNLCSNCPVSEKLKMLSSQLLEDEKPKSIPKMDTPKKSKKSGRWENDEVLYLINHYHLYPLKHLAEKLNRDISSVYNKAFRLHKLKKIQLHSNRGKKRVI